MIPAISALLTGNSIPGNPSFLFVARPLLKPSLDSGLTSIARAIQILKTIVRLKIIFLSKFIKEIVTSTRDISIALANEKWHTLTKTIQKSLFAEARQMDGRNSAN